MNVPRSARAAAAMVAAALAAPPALGQTERSLPDGIPVGPWIIAPYFESDLEADTNVLRVADQPDEAELIAEAEIGVAASLPFRNSLLELNLAGADVTYENQAFQNSFRGEYEADLELNFRSGDTLRLGDTFRRDYVQLREDFGEAGDPTAEDSFLGEPYNFNTWTIALEREDVARQGYVMQVTREDFIYKGQEVAGFLERRGFDTVFETRQPLPGNRWVLAHYNQRRFNHYDPDSDDLIGVPVRKELSDYLQLGFGGSLSNSSYLLRLGYTDFRLVGRGASSYSGVSGYGYLRYNVGGSTGVNFSFSRRPLASNLDTYYISNVGRVGFDWSRRATTVSLNMGLSVNNYADLIVDPADSLGCGGELREDIRTDAQARLRYRLHPQFALQLAGAHERRNSNCEATKYITSELHVGVVLGWF